MRTYHVYIMSNESKMLYVGVTNYLERRVIEHQRKTVPGFTQRYNLHRLVYFEPFTDIRDAIIWEKRIKGWLRSKKVALIQKRNPRWLDLSAEWGAEANASKKS